MKDSRLMNLDYFHGSTRFARIFGFALVMILSLSMMSGCFYLLQSRRDAWENRCKLTLRALGSTQSAFADGNRGDYGTWDELTKAEYIQQGYTRSNMIDNYEISVFDVKKSVKDKNGKILTPSDFVMVAVPRSVKNRLRTFALGSDQTPLVWIGNYSEFDIAKMDLKNSEQWEPLR